MQDLRSFTEQEFRKDITELQKSISESIENKYAKKIDDLAKEKEALENQIKFLQEEIRNMEAVSDG